MKFRTVFSFAAALACATLASQQAGAQAWPSRQITIIVPFGAGSVTDGFARILADRLMPVWKQTVVVENRPGLSGTAAVAKAPADGYTLMLTSNGHTIARAINKDVSFDPVKDFAGVTLIASVPLVAIVPPDSPHKTLKDFVAAAQAAPGKLNFSSAGVASSTFLAAEIFRQDTKLNLVHVPFKGASDAVTAVIRGDTQIYFSPYPNAKELSSAGKVRAIAINTEKRLPQMPDVPTIAESGWPNYKYESWFGLMAPAGTPKDVLVKVSGDIANIMKADDIKERFQSGFGAIPSPSTPEEFDRINAADTERYAKIMKEAGVSAN